MAKIFLFVVLFAVVESTHKHHPKFPQGSDEYQDTPLIKKVACTNDNERMRNDVIEKARCGDPKEVFVYLKPPSKHEQVSPGAVWVKRCVGLCDFEAPGSKCVATSSVLKPISIRIHNVKTGKETCSTYLLEEHTSCGCCALTAEECGDTRIYNPQEPEYEVESI